LGAEFAQHYGALGYRLVLVARDRARLDALADIISTAHDVDVEVLPADLHSTRERARVIRRLRSTRHPISVLVNNAGYGIAGDLHSSDPEEEANHLGIHVAVPLELTKAVLPGMLERRYGRIILVSSVAGYLSRGTYSAHKAWGLSFARSTNEMYRRRGVHVSAVAPGFVRTGFHQRMGMEIAGIPGFLWLDAASVVASGARAVEKGKPVVIPSLRYKVLVGVAALIPRKFHQGNP
jgi:uncharacterized protein